MPLRSMCFGIPSATKTPEEMHMVCIGSEKSNNLA